MSNNLKILLVGTGYMGMEHCKVLLAQGIEPVVVGRSLKKCELFSDRIGIKAIAGGIRSYIDAGHELPAVAIVAVNIIDLFETCRVLIRNGVKRILLEKPGATSREELEALNKEARKYECDILLAYNRRFYSSTRKAIDIIQEDGGVSSFQFEFTEWSELVEKSSEPPEVKDIWILANSSHVIDLAFFLGGYPCEMNSFVSGGLIWHRNGSIYAGAGRTENGALFSYNANWGAPGRWGVEMLTKRRRLIFRPMEKLQIQKLNSVEIEPYFLDDQIDVDFKPGLYEQMRAFLSDRMTNMLGLEEYIDHFDIIEKIAGVGKNEKQ